MTNTDPTVNQYYTVGDISFIQEQFNAIEIPEKGDVWTFQNIVDELSRILAELNDLVGSPTSGAPQAGDYIYLKSKVAENLYLTANPVSKKLTTAETLNHRAVWQLQATDNEGYYNLYNPYHGHYLAALPTATTDELTLTTKQEFAARYAFVNDGHSKYAAIKQLNAPLNGALPLAVSEVTAAAETPEIVEGEEATEAPEAITTYTATTRRGAETQDVALFSVYQTDMFNPSAYNLPLYEDLRAVLHATDTGETSGLSMGNGLGQFDTDDQVEAQAEAIPPRRRKIQKDETLLSTRSSGHRNAPRRLPDASYLECRHDCFQSLPRISGRGTHATRWQPHIPKHLGSRLISLTSY